MPTKPVSGGTLEDGRSAPNEAVLDCAIIGGGPAGLTAALYLARFRREVHLWDTGESRASWIPSSHNQAAFPGGISGPDLLQRMKTQTSEHGVPIITAKVEHVRPSKAGFEIVFAGQVVTAKTVLLATGVVNHRPAMADGIHQQALSRGLLRYCPVCDGFEAMDQVIAVLGADGHGVAEALFLRNYSDRVTLLPARRTELDPTERGKLLAAGVAVLDDPATSFTIAEGKIFVGVDGDPADYAFDTLYPALGSTANVDPIREIVAAVSDAGCLLTDKHQMTTFDGLYAAGDVVEGLDQISVASGQAAIAATAIHNQLRERENLE